MVFTSFNAIKLYRWLFKCGFDTTHAPHTLFLHHIIVNTSKTICSIDNNKISILDNLIVFILNTYL